VKGLLDTSVFIAGEHGRSLATERLPDEAAVSVVTLAELELVVHMAASESIRPSTVGKRALRRRARARREGAARAISVALPRARGERRSAGIGRLPTAVGVLEEAQHPWNLPTPLIATALRAAGENAPGGRRRAPQYAIEGSHAPDGSL
jgi:hypothetical protein